MNRFQKTVRWELQRRQICHLETAIGEIKQLQTLCYWKSLACSPTKTKTIATIKARYDQQVKVKEWWK